MPIVWCERKYCSAAKKVDGEKLYLCTETAIKIMDDESGCNSYDPTVSCVDCAYWELRDTENQRAYVCGFCDETTEPCREFKSKYDKAGIA